MKIYSSKYFFDNKQLIVYFNLLLNLPFQYSERNKELKRGGKSKVEKNCQSKRE